MNTLKKIAVALSSPSHRIAAHYSKDQLLDRAYDGTPYLVIGNVRNKGKIGIDLDESPGSNPLIYFPDGQESYYSQSDLKRVSHEQFFELYGVDSEGDEREAQSKPLCKVSLQRLPDTNEWRVNWWEGNKRNDECSYYTDDKQDAVDTMKDLQKRADEENAKRKGQAGMAKGVVEALQKKGVEKRDVYKEAIDYCIGYLGLDKNKATMVAKSVCEQLGAPARYPRPLAEPRRPMPKGKPITPAESTPEIAQKAQEARSFLREAVGDMAHSILRYPDAGGGEWTKKLQQVKRSKFPPRDIQGWLADEIYNDPGILADLLNDHLNEGDPSTRNAILAEISNGAHGALQKAVQHLLVREDGSREAHIVKEKGGYELKSHSGKNLGKYPTKEGAEERERQVEYFKHKGQKDKQEELDTEQDSETSKDIEASPLRTSQSDFKVGDFVEVDFDEITGGVGRIKEINQEPSVTPWDGPEYVVKLTSVPEFGDWVVGDWVNAEAKNLTKLSGKKAQATEKVSWKGKEGVIIDHDNNELGSAVLVKFNNGEEKEFFSKGEPNIKELGEPSHNCCQCGGQGCVSDPDTGNPYGHACYHCGTTGSCNCPIGEVEPKQSEIEQAIKPRKFESREDDYPDYI